MNPSLHIGSLLPAYCLCIVHLKFVLHLSIDKPLAPLSPQKLSHDMKHLIRLIYETLGTFLHLRNIELRRVHIQNLSHPRSRHPPYWVCRSHNIPIGMHRQGMRQQFHRSPNFRKSDILYQSVTWSLRVIF